MAGEDDPIRVLQHRVQVGVQAQSLLDDAVFQSVMARIVGGAMSLWRSTPVGSQCRDDRDHHHALVYGVDQVAANLEALAVDGRMAQQELDEALDQE